MPIGQDGCGTASRPQGIPAAHASVVWRTSMKQYVKDFESAKATGIKYTRGIPFPAPLKFRQLIITGPPGCGKSRLVEKIGGWPEEGYIDLSMKNWWRDRGLTFRPREVHLGLPFVGLDEALAVFDKAWLEAPEPLKIEYSRIHLPPPKTRLLSIDWRARYVFEFELPPAQEILRWRRERARSGAHPGDVGVTLDLVKRQLAVYWDVASFFASSGMLTYVRDRFEDLHKP